MANYPPFSLWTPEQTPEAIERLGRNGQPEIPLGLYVHIPFCRKRCHFCYFRVYTDKNSNDIQAYLDAVIEEASLFARQPFVGERKLKFIYFGGGTPSYLSAPQLTYLVEGLQRSLPWDNAEEIAFECEPGTLSRKKLRAIRELGVTRLSLGIENFDDEVLRLNNRAHQSKQVHQAYEWARSADYPQINIDLIAGMLGETDENWRRCMDETLRIRPDMVTIYQMEIPHNTTIYRQMRDEGRIEAPVADWLTKRRWVDQAYDALEAAGYTIGSAYTALNNKAPTPFLYRDALWAGADMLGLGVSSFGHLDGVHYQNQRDIVPYVSSISGGDLPIDRAMTMTDEERMIRQFVLQMKLGKLARKPFLDKFGVDVFNRWSQILRRYEDDGYLNLDQEGLVLTRQGLLEVDRLLHAFFLPQHRGARYT